MKIKIPNALIKLIILTVLMSSSVICFADQEGITKYVMDNGLTILIDEVPTTPMVSLYALVKTGSATEGRLLGSGASHFLEHMLFKGTNTRGVGDIPAEIKAVGGNVNASTGKDYTIFTVTVPYQSFDKALDVLSDMMMNAKLDPVELEKERDVILNEMRMVKDNPSRRFSEILESTVYTVHPYKVPVIGYKNLFKDLTSNDLLNYFKTMYSPNNMIISIAGNVSAEEILPKVEESFKNFKRQVDVPRNLVSEPQQISQRRYEEQYDTDITRLAITFSGVSLRDKDLYALDTLARILGGGASSRLYSDIYKDKKLVYQISSYDYTPLDKGYFQISALLDYKNVEKVIDSVMSQIERIKDKGIKKVELDKAKREVLSEFVFSRQTSSSLAYSQALDEAFTGDYLFSEKYVKLISDVAREDVIRVANKYLDPETMSIVILKPKTEMPEVKMDKNKQKEGKINKYVLDNGLILLLREDSTLPLVDIRVVMNGGVRNEPEELNGISEMTSYLMTRGTETMDSKKLDEMVESMGMSLGSFSGQNSFGIELDCLKEDIDKGLDILNDVIRNPSFKKDEIEKARDKMKAAIRQREDSIMKVTSMELKEMMFSKDPFRLDKNGTMESINRIKRKDIEDFYGKFTAANNMIISVFGDIDTDKVLDVLKNKFSSIKNHALKLEFYDEPAIKEPKVKEITMKKEQALVLLGFHGTTFKSEDKYGLEVLTSILGSSFNGRLFEDIRETLGQAYSLGGASIPGIDTGFVYFYVLTDKQKAYEVKDLLDNEIKKIIGEKVTDKELEDIKTYLKGSYLAGLETNSSLSFKSSLDELYGLGHDNYLQYNQKIDAVTKEDILKAARKYLDLNSSVTVIANPLKSN